MSLEEAIRLAVDQDVEQLIHLQEREELEEVYGIPVIVSVFVSSFGRVCLHIPPAGGAVSINHVLALRSGIPCGSGCRCLAY